MKVVVIKGKKEGEIIEATEHILQPLLDAGIVAPYDEKEEKQSTETKELKTRGRKTKNG